MGKIKSYVKRGVKYILKDYKQPIVKIDVVQKKPNEMFKGKIYLITGGSTGLGFYMAKKLIAEGAMVIITGRKNDKLVTAKEILGKNCDYVVYDIQDISLIDKVLSNLFLKYKNIDGIINNAGISLHEWDFLKVDEKKFDSQFQTNLKGAYFLTQAYIRKILKEKKTANIIFITSERGTMCDDLPYGLTKASINSLVQALSYKYYKSGIRVNGIAPGVTVSNMTGLNKDGDLYNNNTSNRYFLPEEIAEVATFLLSDYSKCISGEIIHCNAGNHIKRGY